MSVLIVTHPSSHRHVTPPGHPERVARIEAVQHLLATLPYADLPRITAPAASRKQLARAHASDYIDAIESSAPEEGFVSLDPDTHMSPGSLEAARHAAGSAVAAVDAVLKGSHRAAFCAVRPCGHHAEYDRAMGFCLFDNVAVGAMHALEVHGLKRVAIVDFDVHHGNGTQDIFQSEPRVFFASSHQYPLYPGTGAAHETGVGNILNAPLSPMSGGKEMRSAYEGQILPAVDEFKPELLIVSAGFDAHVNDPLANLNWMDADFGWVTAELCKLAAKHCDGRIVSALEGGYDLEGLIGGLRAHLDALIDHVEAR
ncbi:histone deacetylase family protein [Paralimibaculum aggregatum]|uniref:Histone deacetylase family protein n=1 Tax=Paralimibaculum aggregatum TaxID=3036245 RepID=A0ABQ6LPD5_9RHOB|nr:histone deacetylase family protein [Limibaculum sp. NKW23]GMG82499.1 histone deacetylase family protein [Limibaculum sp. NKW23]